MKRLRDAFWIWGHPTNSLYNEFSITRESKMPPVEGMRYLGAENLFLVPMDVPVDRMNEAELAKDVRDVGLSINRAWSQPENVTEAIEISKKYSNISRAIFDDFFRDTNPDNNHKNYTPEKIAQIRELFHEAGLELWLVLYLDNFKEIDKETIKSFIKEFDGVSFWFWDESDTLEHYDEHIQTFFDVSEGKKRLVGCYLYDFGGCKPASPEAVVFQLEKEREMIKKGLIEGVILHTNAVVVNPPYEAVEAGREWLEKYGDEIVEE